MVDISFLKKITFPRFSLKLFQRRPSSVIGIDIGTFSTKVVQLKYEGERAILETYGELLNAHYFKETDGVGANFLSIQDSDVAELIRDLLRESNSTSKYAVFSIPAASSFITLISFPNIPRKEIEQAIPYEARKYIPIPMSEVVLDWEIFDAEYAEDLKEILLVAVPREVIEKFRRVAEGMGITPLALEVEIMSLVRSLIGSDQTPIALLNIGSLFTTVALVDKGRVRVFHNFNRGSHELTRTLERGLGINMERAEAIKRETGLSEKMEEHEIASVIFPLVDTLFNDVDRVISIYNRRAKRKIQKMYLTGGGSHLKGIVEYAASKFAIEVSRGNPFARVVTPPFMQPILREIGPNFAVSVGLALHGITNK